MTTLDPSTLRIDVEEKEHWRRTMKVTVPADFVASERASVLKKLGGRLKLPGFRSGHVPADVVEKRFGASVQQEMLDRVIGDAYKEALRLHALSPISQGEVEDVTYERDEDLAFSISFDVRPEIEIGRLGGFKIERPSDEVEPGAVDQVLERLRHQNAAWRPVDGGEPQEGDMVSVSVTRLVDGAPDGEPQDYDLTLGEGEAIPDVEASIRSLAVGETGEFHVTFPEDFPNEERRGEEQDLRIELKARKIKELPELDDGFARSLGDFDDLESLRERVREDLEAEQRERSEAVVRGSLVRQLLEANPFQVPQSMVDRYIDSVLGDTSEADPGRVAEAREQLRTEAEHAVKRFLLIDRIAQLESLTATEEEIDERVQKIAEENDQSPAQVYARLQKAGRLEQLEQDLTEEKVFEKLKTQSEIVEAG